MNSKTSKYHFVLTPIDTMPDVRCELIPGYYLQKANIEQANHIKSILGRFDPGCVPVSLRIYEKDKKTTAGGSGLHEHVRLSRESWRYWVVQYEGSGSEVTNLDYALSLMEQDIELGFYVSEATSSFGFTSQHVQTFLNERDDDSNSPVIVTQSDLNLAIDCCNKIIALSLSNSDSHILRAFQRLNTLRDIPRLSDLTVIGLSSVIETLLTHAPKANDPTDSLTRQIKNKMPLVRKRFRREIDHSKFFLTIEEDKLWVKLYEYRSKIVHGEDAKLNGQLQVLNDQKAVVSFLREIVKLLLILSLDEPVLMADLKKC